MRSNNSNKTIFLTLITAALISMAFTSCNKEEEDEFENQPPTIYEPIVQPD